MTTLFETRHHCPTCHEKSSSTLFSSPLLEPPLSQFFDHFYGDALPRHHLANTTLTLLECAHCHLIYQTPILNATGMKNLYEEWTTTEPASLAHRIELTQELLTLIAHLGNDPQRLTLLDYGMGSGTWCELAHSFGCTVYGHDLAQWSMGAPHSFRTLSHSEIADHQFDFINTEQVFEHLPSPRETLLHLTQSLKPGGILKISVPNGRSIKQRLRIGNWTSRQGARDDLNPISPLQHINCFTNQSLIHLGSQAQLKQIRIPISTWCRHTLRWNSRKWWLKNFIKPLKQRYFNRGTYLFFTKEAKHPA